MKHLIITLATALLISGTASAQRFQVGIRGGVNFTDHKFDPVRIGETTFSPGPARAGYEAGVVLRFNLSRHLHLHSEFNYAFTNYNVRETWVATRNIALKTERFQIPVGLGLQFGVLRLFAGALFRVSQAAESSAPRQLRIGFNDSDIGFLGGLGIHISKFFIDFRITGFPRSHVWQRFVSGDIARRVKIGHDLVYGSSLGFFF